MPDMWLLNMAGASEKFGEKGLEEGPQEEQ